MATTLFFNGPILSMDGANSSPQAVLVEGDTIRDVGDEARLRSAMPPDSEEFDLRGRTMMPAFIDPHGHFPDPGFHRLFRVDLSSPPRGDCPDMATALDRLRERAATTPPGEWIMGVLFDNTSIAERRMPLRTELDTVSKQHPIWVMHASGHNGVANSLALEVRGIGQNTADPLGGRIDRDPRTGELTGLVEGLSAMGDIADTDFLIDRERFWQGFAATREEYFAQGVTYAQNAWATRRMLEHFASCPADRDPGYDLMLLPIGELEPELSQGRDALSWPGNPHFTIGPRKLFTDGAFQMQTAFLSRPYHRVLNPDYPNGTPYTTAEEHGAQVRKLHDLGFQIHCHTNGDAGIDMVIRAVAAAQEANPRTDHRHTAIHCQAMRDDQLERMAQLGMTASFFSAHIYYWGDRHYDTFLGPERAGRISPAASAERLGVRYTLHNDAPVTSTRPLHLAACAVTRRTSGGRILGEDQRISVLAALRAMTIDAAWQVFQDHVRGSIETGKLADLIILDRNPLEGPAALEKTVVTHTIRRGARVWEIGTGLVRTSR